MRGFAAGMWVVLIILFTIIIVVALVKADIVGIRLSLIVLVVGGISLAGLLDED